MQCLWKKWYFSFVTTLSNTRASWASSSRYMHKMGDHGSSKSLPAGTPCLCWAHLSRQDCQGHDTTTDPTESTEGFQQNAIPQIIIWTQLCVNSYPEISLHGGVLFCSFAGMISYPPTGFPWLAETLLHFLELHFCGSKKFRKWQPGRRRATETSCSHSSSAVCARAWPIMYHYSWSRLKSKLRFSSEAVAGVHLWIVFSFRYRPQGRECTAQVTYLLFPFNISFA